MPEWQSIQSLSGKERKNIIEEAEDMVEDPASLIPKKGQTSKFVDDNGVIGYVAHNKDLVFIQFKDYLVPSLRAIQDRKVKAPKVIVDKGAISFVTNGADIMRPGIVHIDDGVLEGQIVLVTEENNDAALCFGVALYDAVDMREMDNGKVVKNIHYLSDDWWEFTP